jgi:hypothetical protein
MLVGDRRNFINAAEGVDLLVGGFHAGMAGASQAVASHQGSRMYDRAVAAKAASDARYNELCHAWHLLADQHDRALARIEQLERRLAQR